MTVAKTAVAPTQVVRDGLSWTTPSGTKVVTEIVIETQGHDEDDIIWGELPVPTVNDLLEDVNKLLPDNLKYWGIG
jgi:hypothetical protein